MKRIVNNRMLLIIVAATLLFTTSCEKFLNPDQAIDITEDRLYGDWYEYRSVVMGLYGLQQQLVEQLMVLGELRADLLEVTPNADADLVEVYNFNISKNNKYASPTGMFKLISACNSFIHNLKKYHPEVLDKSSTITNYDRLYGEALAMRAWAYFNAVRIYGKVPYIPESLTTIDEIDAYINSTGTYVDSVHIVYGVDGYTNDTSYNVSIEFEKQYWDQEQVLDYYTTELENEIKAIGVNHYIVNGDDTWDACIWTEFGLHALLGHMYLSLGDLTQAAEHFMVITDNSTTNLRYHLDYSFGFYSWRDIFNAIDLKEHIYTIPFRKADFQQNEFQDLFSPLGPHSYKLKPTYGAIFRWETQWRGQVIDIDNAKPANTEMIREGSPTDIFRGIGLSVEGESYQILGSSYMYYNNEVPISGDEYVEMVILRMEGDMRNSKVIMENMDTVVYKYSIGKDIYDQDANYIIYRAGGIHLYLAEIFAHWYNDFENNDKWGYKTLKAEAILNDGSWYGTSSAREELGVRGRVALGSGDDAKKVENYVFLHDPWTNEVTGYIELTDFQSKQYMVEENIMEERALELAFEGERFYDLMRVAKRRNDPSYLAKKVAAKFPASRQAEIESYLMDESNWYIKYFEEDTPELTE